MKCRQVVVKEKKEEKTKKPWEQYSRQSELFAFYTFMIIYYYNLHHFAPLAFCVFLLMWLIQTPDACRQL